MLSYEAILLIICPLVFIAGFIDVVAGGLVSVIVMLFSKVIVDFM